ncbi:MAG: carboxypeptidase regulatory-like domain-containing protein, partial [bacterium]|nr:carboxypeptidase regulatory-like domain-containing protein [bacterium]
GDAVELDLDFATRNRLLGLVLLDGAPLGGARVFARCGEKGLIPSRITRSDGRFEFDRIPTGRCRLLIHHQLGIRAFRQLEIEGDREVVFDLRPKTVSGQVLSAADLTPLADVRIELFVEARHPSHQTRTDATGRFTLSGVEPGVWPLWASRPGHAMARTRVEVGPEDAGEARILMNPARRAELVVRNPDGTVPPSVQVTVTGASGHFTSYRFQPDSQGRIVLDVLCAGTWSLRISGDRGEAQIEIEIPGPPVRVELTSP